MKFSENFMAGFDSRGGRAALICLCLLILFYMIHTTVKLQEQHEAKITKLSEDCKRAGGVPQLPPPAFFIHGGKPVLVICGKE